MCEVGGNCVKCLKRERNRKKGRGNKDFKKGGQAGSRGGYLKMGGGDWDPVKNYITLFFIFTIFSNIIY